MTGKLKNHSQRYEKRGGKIKEEMRGRGRKLLIRMIEEGENEGRNGNEGEEVIEEMEGRGRKLLIR
jgi:hypothetical protein